MSHSDGDPAHFTQEFWDDRYRSAGGSGRCWSDQPNPQLVAQGCWDVIVADAPGRSATDLDGRPVTVRDTVLRAARRPA